MNRRYSIREQFTKDICELTIWCYCKGYAVTDGEAYRTKEQQAIYVSSGRSKVKVSQHQKRLARDLHIWDEFKGAKYITDSQWREVGRKWESMNSKNRWGGRFGVRKINYNKKIGWDKYHFERRS